MGFWNDFGHAAKNVGKGAAKVADVATDTIIDKDAWGRTAAAIADGKGGKTIKGSDLLNMALDSTMLIPGVGLAGGAARVGVRGAARMAENAASKELAELAAKRAADKTLLRSPVNNAIRGSVDDLFKRTGRDAMIRDGLKTGGEKGALKAAGKSAKWDVKDAELAAKKPHGVLRSQVDRMALKQEKGIGTKVGFGQTRKRILLNTALAGGANLGVRTYDELTGARPGPASKSKKKKDGGTATDAGTLAGLLGGNFTFTTADGGEQTIKGQDLAALLASYADQNNTVEGAQVIHTR